MVFLFLSSSLITPTSSLFELPLKSLLRSEETSVEESGVDLTLIIMPYNSQKPEQFQILNLQNNFQMIKHFSHSFYTITGKYHKQSFSDSSSECEPGCPKNRNSRKNPSIRKSLKNPRFLGQVGTRL